MLLVLIRLVEIHLESLTKLLDQYQTTLGALSPLNPVAWTWPLQVCDKVSLGFLELCRARKLLSTSIL